MKRISKPMFFHANLRISAIFWIFICMCWVVFVPMIKKTERIPALSETDENWLAFQKVYDSLKQVKLELRNKKYPFNPNFISPYRAYQWGMTTDELSRLQHFRNQGNFINSIQQFQEVTQVSDSLLSIMSPYITFPEWVKASKSAYANKTGVRKNLNNANLDDLTEISGIGMVLGNRILDYRNRLGCFVDISQVEDVYGLNEQVISKLKQNFYVTRSNERTVVKINEASMRDLQLFPYFNASIAREIVALRSMNGRIQGIDDLTKINNFPVDKLKIIALYLEF